MNCHPPQAPKCDIIVVVCVLGGQAACGDAGPHEKVAGRRGRPPGSKNKRTLAMESLAQQGLTAGQQQAAMALLKQRAEQKRQEDEENLQAAIASGQKRRGRPPGSRNRPRDEGTYAYECHSAAKLLAGTTMCIRLHCPLYVRHQTGVSSHGTHACLQSASMLASFVRAAKTTVSSVHR